jgi:hypothetical protein
MKLQKQFYAILGMPTWVPQEFRNKALKHFFNCQMIGPAPKPWNMYDSQKQWCVLTNERGPKITLFALNCGSIDVLTWIFVHSMWSQKEIFDYGKKRKEKVELEHWSCLLNKFETFSHWKYHIKTKKNDYHKQKMKYMILWLFIHM